MASIVLEQRRVHLRWWKGDGDGDGEKRARRAGSLVSPVAGEWASTGTANRTGCQWTRWVAAGFRWGW